MKHPLTTAIILGAAVLAGCQSTSGQQSAPQEKPRLEVGGTRMGDSGDAALARTDAPTCKRGPLPDMLVCDTWNYSAKLVGVPVEIYQLEISQARVQWMTGGTKGNGDQLVAATKRQYGQPLAKKDNDGLWWDIGFDDQLLILPKSGAWAIVAKSKKDQRDANPRLGLPPPDIKGIKLGDGVSEIMERFPEAHCGKENPAENVQACALGRVVFGGSRAATLSTALRDGKTFLISVNNLDPSDHDSLILAMSTKFGPPDTTEQRPKAASESDVTWSLPYERLLVAEAGDPKSRPSVLLIDRIAAGEMSRSNAERKASTL